MSEQLLGDEALRIVRLIDRYSEFVGRLREYPSVIVDVLFNRDKYIGPRTLMWLLRAIYAVESDPFNARPMQADQLQKVCKASIECLYYTKHEKKELIWRTSALASLNELVALCEMIPNAVANGILEVGLNEIETYRRELTPQSCIEI